MKKKLAKAAKDPTQTSLPESDEKKKREKQFSIALDVIENADDMKHEVEALENVDDISSLRKEFSRVMTEVFKNIVPKTIPLNLRNSYNQFGVNRWGVAHRNRYSSRYDSDTMHSLIGQDIEDFSWHADLGDEFKYSDKGADIPKKYKGMTPAQIYLLNAIDCIESNGFRTKKRSVERLKRVLKFVEEHEELLKKREDRIKIEVDDCFVFNMNSGRYYHSSNRNVEKGFVTQSMILEYDGRYNLRLMSDSDEFSLSDCHRKLDHAFAFANLYPQFKKWLGEITKVKEARAKVVEGAIADLRKAFSKEMLIAKAKQITN